MSTLTPKEKLVHCVVPLEKVDSAGNCIGLATGFVMGFCEQEDGLHVPVIITNRHVLQNCSGIRAIFTIADPDGSPQIGKTVSVFTPRSSFFLHPDPTIDLGFLPFPSHGPNGEALFYSHLQTSLIPSPTDWASFDAIENVVMAGYPKGLRDTINNFPIVRKGITATPPSVDFEGLPIFLVDMPCFEGCSGSPVFILEQGGYYDPRNKSANIGKDRIYLLGIQYEIPLSQAAGDLKTFPSASIAVKPVVPLYLNIGRIIKSSALLDFDPIIRAQVGL